MKLFPSHILSSIRIQKSEIERKKMESQEGGGKMQIAIRCAKAANLLSSLQNRQFKATINNEVEEKKMMKREIGDLKVKLVRERMKINKIKLSGLMDAVIQVSMVLFVCAFLLMIAFNFNQN